MYDSELKMSDFAVSESWTDSVSGDSVHHVVRCLAWIKRYNISGSTENGNGGACGDFWTQNADSLVSFVNLVNNCGRDVLMTFYGGSFYSKS